MLICHHITLNEIIKIAKELEAWIHGHTNEIEYPNNPELALLQQSQDICSAISILLEAKLPGPAYALARPMLDTCVRGLWLLNHKPDKEEEIKELFEGKKWPGFDDLLKEIGKDEETGGAWIGKISELNRQAFNGLVHGGIEHVLRRATINSTEPNYPEDEQIRLMHVQIGIQLVVGYELLALVDNQAGIAKLEEMARQYGTAVRDVIS